MMEHYSKVFQNNHILPFVSLKRVQYNLNVIYVYHAAHLQNLTFAKAAFIFH